AGGESLVDERLREGAAGRGRVAADLRDAILAEEPRRDDQIADELRGRVDAEAGEPRPELRHADAPLLGQQGRRARTIGVSHPSNEASAGFAPRFSGRRTYPNTDLQSEVRAEDGVSREERDDPAEGEERRERDAHAARPHTVACDEDGRGN